MNNTIIIAKIRALFLTGGKHKAKQENALCSCNEARKCISSLRSTVMNIQDIRFRKSMEFYWYVSDINQFKLEL